MRSLVPEEETDPSSPRRPPLPRRPEAPRGAKDVKPLLAEFGREPLLRLAMVLVKYNEDG
jgi:hypothetical protein